MSEPTMLEQFNLDVDAVNDALNYARGHLVLNDLNAAISSFDDAEACMAAARKRLEDAEDNHEQRT